MNVPTMPGPGGRGIWAVFVALMAFGQAGVEASAVTYEFAGVITPGNAPSGMTPLMTTAGIKFGTTFSGTFSLDPNELSRGISIEGDESYSVDPTASNASESMTVSFAGGPTYTLLPGSLRVNIFEVGLTGWSLPSQKTLTGTDLLISGTLPNGMQIQIDLNNPNKTLDPTLALPNPIRLSDYTTAQLSELVGTNSTSIAPGTPIFIGKVTSLEPMPAPEPATLLILGSGLTGWAARRGCRMARRPH